MPQMRPMLAAQKYRTAGDLWSPAHEKVVQQHLDTDGYLIMQPKWDGFRGIQHEGTVKSRSWLPLANTFLQQFAQTHPLEFDLVDGETFPGDRYHAAAFREAMSGIRSASDSASQLVYVLYDFLRYHEYCYTYRRKMLQEHIFDGGTERLVELDGGQVRLLLCPQVEVRSLEEIYAEEARLLALGFEGGITRRINRRYKFNRSTALGGELTKVKRRDYVDAQVIGYEQRYANRNELQTSELGYAKRSSHQEGLVPLDMLGAIHIRILNGPLKGVEQKCGVFRGLSHEDLKALWDIRETLPGRYCEVSVDKADGGYDAARCPVWIRWRDASEFGGVYE